MATKPKFVEMSKPGGMVIKVNAESVAAARKLGWSKKRQTDTSEKEK